jgi:tRNA-dihydrouridine synthase
LSNNIISDTPLPPTISLGPFQGITDHIFRNHFETFFGSVDKLYTPFFTAIHKADSKNLQGAELDPVHNDISKLIPQILSNEAAEIKRFAGFCSTLGYKEINLNMGCPFPRVARKKRGSGMLPYPELVDQILTIYFENPSLNLSIKCRLGYLEHNEIEKLIPVFNKFPLAELIVHARTGKQLYKETANPSAFNQIKNNFRKIPAYNGDIFTLCQFTSLRAIMPDVDHFMLGRGLLADPFLAAEIKGRQFINKKSLLEAFLYALFTDRLRETNYALTTLGRMKELWSYLRWSFDDPVNTWRLIKKTNSIESYEDAVKMIFSAFEWKGSGFANPKNSD